MTNNKFTNVDVEEKTDTSFASSASSPEQPESSTKATTNPISRRVIVTLTLLCIASFIAHVILLPHMPEMIPSHWNAAGDVDGWSSRSGVLFLDALPLLFLPLFYFLPKMDPRGNAYERMASFYTGFVCLFTVFMIAITWTSELTVFGFMPQTGSPLGTIVSGVVGLGLILMGNYLPKVKRNYTFGCKTPWALDNDANWRLTNRFCGIAFVISGIAIIVSGFIAQQQGELGIAILLFAVLGSSFATYAYSYFVFQNGNKPLRSK